jgi:SAM-dependent methyltransferase
MARHSTLVYQEPRVCSALSNPAVSFSGEEHFSMTIRSATGFETTSPSLPTLSTPRARLKARLQQFWNSQTLYWDLMTEEIASDSVNRARAASFIPEGSRVLDAACGSAANCVWLLGRVEYFGVDISLSGLKRAQRAEIHLACADAEALPFGEGTFDAVLSTYALEHSANPVQLLKELVRTVRIGGRIVLLGPAWDFPFWYPNSLLSRARSISWRVGYTLKRFASQMKAILGGPSPYLIVEEPDAFTQPFVYDADAVYVVWSYEVVRQMKIWGCKLVHIEVDDQLLGSNTFVRLFKRLLKLLPAYRHAGSTLLMVFER